MLWKSVSWKASCQISQKRRCEIILNENEELTFGVLDGQKEDRVNLSNAEKGRNHYNVARRTTKS
jgi:hypothetical protein